MIIGPAAGALIGAKLLQVAGRRGLFLYTGLAGLSCALAWVLLVRNEGSTTHSGSGVVVCSELCAELSAKTHLSHDAQLSLVSCRRAEPVGRLAKSGGGAEVSPLLLLFSEQVHVQVPRRFYPVLVHLYCQRPHQPKTARRIREDPHHQRPPFQLLVEPLQHVRRLQVLVVLPAAGA